MLERLLKLVGVNRESFKMYHHLFADDTELVADSWENLHGLVDAFNVST